MSRSPSPPAEPAALTTLHRLPLAPGTRRRLDGFLAACGLGPSPRGDAVCPLPRRDAVFCDGDAGGRAAPVPALALRDPTVLRTMIESLQACWGGPLEAVASQWHKHYGAAVLTGPLLAMTVAGIPLVGPVQDAVLVLAPEPGRQTGSGPEPDEPAQRPAVLLPFAIAWTPAVPAPSGHPRQVPAPGGRTTSGRQNRRRLTPVPQDSAAPAAGSPPGRGVAGSDPVHRLPATSSAGQEPGAGGPVDAAPDGPVCVLCTGPLGGCRHPLPRGGHGESGHPLVSPAIPRTPRTPRPPRAPWMDDLLAVLLRDYLAPVVHALNQATGVRPTTLWTNTANLCASLFEELAAAGAPTAAAAAHDAAWLLAAPALGGFDPNPLAGRIRYAGLPWWEAEGSMPQRIRRSCCLRYRLPGGQPCHCCPLRWRAARRQAHPDPNSPRIP